MMQIETPPTDRRYERPEGVPKVEATHINERFQTGGLPFALNPVPGVEDSGKPHCLVPIPAQIRLTSHTGIPVVVGLIERMELEVLR